MRYEGGTKMRAPHDQKEEAFVNVFPPRKVADVKVRCLLQQAIDIVGKIHKNDALPYSASLDIISELFDGGFNQRAYKAIYDLNHRLCCEEHPCGEQTEDCLNQMVQTIDKAHLLTESGS
jgi:hypothetical protein